MVKENDVKKYIQFYSTDLGKKILERETRFVNEKLMGYKKVLSTGCGPAILEKRLIKLNPGLNITCIDNSKEMIEQSPKEITVFYGDAQHLEFKDNMFDAVLYVTSLEFIKNIKKAIQESHRVLKSEGSILVLMLNTKSNYFKEEYNDNNSYIKKNTRHTNIEKIQKIFSQYFSIKNKEYFLGITEQDVVDNADQSIASIYVLEGKKL